MKDYLSICSVSQSFLPYMGGLTKYVNALGRQFVKDGHEFRVVHFKTSNIGAVDFSSGIQLVRADIERLGEDAIAGYMGFKESLLNATHTYGQVVEPEKTPGFEGYCSINSRIHEYIEDIYEYKPFDILHIHDFQLLPLSGIGKELGVPTVFTWHIPFTSSMNPAWKNFIINYMKGYDRVVLSTQEYVDTATASGLEEKKIALIHPFIDPIDYVLQGENDARKKLGIAEDEFLVLCVSRMDPRKGQEVLVRAMKKVAAEVPNAKCVFVGNGSFSQELLKKERGGMHKKLLDAVDELGLGEKVKFTGYLPDGEVNKLYAASDVVIQPSFQEGFGLTVTEGMLFEKAVIGSRVGGLMVQIKEGENGFLFTAGDSDGLAEKIIAIALNKQLREKMGSTGREYVDYLKKEGYEKHVRMYRGLCEEREKLCNAP